MLDDPELTTILQLYCLSNAWVMFAMKLAMLEAANTVRVVGGEEGVGVGVGVSEGVGVGDAVCVGVGEGEAVGVGVGEAVWEGVRVGVGVGVVLLFPENVPA